LTWEKIRSSLVHGVSSGYCWWWSACNSDSSSLYLLCAISFAIFEPCVLFTLPHHHASVKLFILVLFMHS
jgi:hypothetical protein